MKIDVKEAAICFLVFWIAILAIEIIRTSRNIKTGVVIVSEQAFVCKLIPLVGNE